MKGDWGKKMHMSLCKSRSHSLTMQIIKISLEMLSVRPQLQRQRRMLLSSVLLIYQFHLSLMWTKLQPAGSFPLSVSVSHPDSEPCGLMGKRDLGVHGWTEALCVQSVRQTRYRVVFGTFGTDPWEWEGDYPELPVSVRQHGNRKV